MSFFFKITRTRRGTYARRISMALIFLFFDPVVGSLLCNLGFVLVDGSNFIWLGSINGSAGGGGKLYSYSLFHAPFKMKYVAEIQWKDNHAI
ncbi:uncharacterized protein EV154DRAFT_509011 [Mucor mucedo]|uniref:uncharacterized protein n=1 Tax=Mucor mucedo TaxID=29922 RepID=UPI00221F2462|nr:uncharacterized protein EV154DRAFT_509011 [Mucor mucedo]KAI7891206.1 hypothetical protein EV154DRAFT_509011 [Mucor mucedo]